MWSPLLIKGRNFLNILYSIVLTICLITFINVTDLNTYIIKAILYVIVYLGLTLGKIYSIASSHPTIFICLCVVLAIAIATLYLPIPGGKCPFCASRGIDSWVLPGKNCPKCGHPC